MSRSRLARSILFCVVTAGTACSVASRAGTGGTGPVSGSAAPERAIRRDIPLTNTIRRAFAAGTRDSSGRPGRNYWQLRTDYTIQARLDPSTQRLTGRETIVVKNNSPDTLRQIGLRLDMNHFLFNVPRAASWVPSEETDGMVITRLAVNGEAVPLAAPQGGRGGSPIGVAGLKTTVARVGLAQPV